jgi:hypothetical protein
MNRFFYPSSIAVFGVADHPRNLARNIVTQSLEFGFRGSIYPVGRKPGTVGGKAIITNPEALPEGIDLAVILVPARFVAETLNICGRRGSFAPSSPQAGSGNSRMRATLRSRRWSRRPGATVSGLSGPTASG